MRIRDSALVAAAVLSHRYIADRFLPDKAIDLVDEAAARLRMQMDSSPIELDEANRRVMQLEIELAAMAKEPDHVREPIERELAEAIEERDALAASWAKEKEALVAHHATSRRRIGELRMEVERAQRDANYQRASEILYSEIPALERELQEREDADAGPTMVKEEVDEDDIASVVARWTGIPVDRLLESETEKLIHLEERLHERVVGQDEAVSAVANALRRARTGLQDPDRPIGSFVFLGPTGVGKTELARALAEFMFDDEKAMIRIDMSEYQERHTVSRLVGAPPGYVGYDEGGQLTEAVRRRPYSVVLLDEIEKAHTEVFNVLLQVLDDGRLTDGQGRTVDFRNTVLIMTSNIRSAESMREHFRPEFLNRIDEIVQFEQLTREQIGDIVDRQLARLRTRLAARSLAIELTDDAKRLIADAGWDPAYGARPLKRAIQRLLENPLALRLLEGDFREGDTIRADARERVLEQALDRALQRARAVGRVPAGVGDRPFAASVSSSVEPALGEPRARSRSSWQLDDSRRAARASARLNSTISSIRFRNSGRKCSRIDLGAADVRRHDQHRVAEVDRAALAVGQPAVVEHLQQHVEHLGVRLLDLVEQDDRVRPPAHRLGQLAALVVADVARAARRPGATRCAAPGTRSCRCAPSRARRRT